MGVGILVQHPICGVYLALGLMNIYVPLISALVGALIGAAASVITVIVQSHYQNKRELVKQAVSTALEDWKTRLAIVTPQGGSALPLSVFIHYHTKLVALAEQGKITPDAIRSLHQEQEDLVAAIQGVNGRTSPERP